jgi:YcxB-like protein
MASAIVVRYDLTRELYEDLRGALGRKATGLSVFGWGILMWILVTFPTRALLGKYVVAAWPTGAQLFLAAIISGAIVSGFLLSAKRKAQKAFAGEDQLEFRFSESGVDKRTKLSETKLEWPAYARYFETDKYILLCYANQTVDPLPKNAFVTPEELVAFKELLNRKVKPAANDPHPVLGRTSKIVVVILIIGIVLLVVFARHFGGK